MATCKQVHWWLVAEQHWFAVVSKPGETAHDSFVRSLGNELNITVSKPAGFNPYEWKCLLYNHSVYQPKLTVDLPT